jgi:flagellar M-ring protein FliF
MQELIDEIKQKISDQFGKLSSKQKIAFIFSAVFVMVMFGLILIWANKPSMTKLYSGLNEKDASQIVDKLKELNAEYTLDNNGTTIYVTNKDLYNLKLEMAKSGLPESSGNGYEMFDDVNIGMTDFLQKLNYRRALETELSRTIEQMDEVQTARVHIVIPEDRLFREDQKETTASIILKLKRNVSLEKGQTQGLAFLLSSAVEGLKVKNITIVDQAGRVLNSKSDGNEAYSATSNQLEVQQKVENHLSSKAQSILDQALGYSNSVVRVNVDLDFNKVDRQVEKFDPESQVVRSEEVREDESNQLSQQNQPNASKKNSTTITNYEIDRILESINGEVGRVKRITASVLINDRLVMNKNEEGDVVKQYEKWNDEDIQTFSDIVKNAIGFSEDRSDQINVQNVTFDPIVNQQFEEEPSQYMNLFDNIGVKFLIVLSVIGAMLIVRSIINTIRETQLQIDEQREKQLQNMRVAEEQQTKELGTGKSSESAEGKKRLKMLMDSSEELPEEVLMRQEITERVSHYINDKPVDAANLIRVWINDGDDD